jgi:hypothetical protein
MGPAQHVYCFWDDIETLQHVLICQQNEVTVHREAQLPILICDLNTIGMPTLISKAIMHGITSWIDMGLGV